jgi:hypothetical protein
VDFDTKIRSLLSGEEINEMESFVMQKLEQSKTRILHCWSTEASVSI